MGLRRLPDEPRPIHVDGSVDRAGLRSPVPLEAGVEPCTSPGESGAAAQEARLRDGVPVQDVCWERLERRAASVRDACTVVQQMVIGRNALW